MKERSTSLDILRAIAIYLVIAGHIITNCIENGQNSLICGIIYHIHIPLFLFISGLLTKDKQLNVDFWKGILQRFVIPFTVWSIVMSLWFLGYKKLIQYDCMYILQQILNDSWMWYIPKFIIIYVCWQLLKPLEYWKRTILGAIIIYAFNDFSITLWCFVWYGLAASIKRYLPINDKRVKVLLFIVLLISLPFASFDSSYVIFLIRSQDIQNINWIAIGLQLIIGLSFCVLLYSMNITKNVSIGGNILCRIGQNTLSIYMLQTLLVETILPRFFRLPEGFLSHCLALVLATVMTFICYEIIQVTSKNRVLRIVLWGNKLK